MDRGTVDAAFCSEASRNNLGFFEYELRLFSFKRPWLGRQDVTHEKTLISAILLSVSFKYSTIWEVFFFSNATTCSYELSWFFSGCGDSVADFWGWDAHEALLRCPDDVSGDMQEDEITGGALRLNLLTTQTMVTTGIFPCKEKFPW